MALARKNFVFKSDGVKVILDAAEKNNADVMAISTLVATTTKGMFEVITIQ